MGSSSSLALVWLRNSLRVADNEALLAASRSSATNLLIYYALDPSRLRPRAAAGAGLELVQQLPSLGPHQCAFLLDALRALQGQLESSYGATLHFCFEPAASAARALTAGAMQNGCQQVSLFHFSETDFDSAQEEAAVAAAVTEAAHAAEGAAAVHSYWGATLYHPADLPSAAAFRAALGAKPLRSQAAGGTQAPRSEAAGAAAESGSALEEHRVDLSKLAAVPAVMTNFIKGMDAHGRIRAPLPRPERLQPLPDLPDGLCRDIPADAAAAYAAAGASDTSMAALQELTGVSYTGAEDMRSAMAGLRGGEAAGMQHLLGFLYGCGERDGHRSAAAHGRPPAGGGAAAAHSGAGSPAWQPPTAVAPVDGRGCAPPGEGFREPRLAAGAQRDPGTIGQGRGCGPAPPIEGFREARMTASTARGASAKLSAYLALGALSPRQVHAALAAHQGRAAGGDRHTGPDGAGPGGACGRGGEGAAPGDEGPSVSAGVRRGRTANPEGSANEAGVGHGAGASRALVDRGASTDARSARREGRDRDSHEAEVGAGAEPGPAPDAPSGAATLAMHLQIRDFFIFSTLREWRALRQPGGLRGEAPPQPWAPADPRLPFVDAAMCELGATGYMNNRGRQNVANLFAKGLHVDWRLGAAVFQALLVDHDEAVNTGNWAYNSGVGLDPRDRIFRTVSQGEKYDPEARYIRAWVPELANLPPELAHQPWRAPGGEPRARGYPPPLLPPETQVARGPRRDGQS